MNKYIKFVLILSLLLTSVLLIFKNNKSIEEVKYYPGGELKSLFHNRNSGDMLCGNEFYKSGAIRYTYCRHPKTGINGELKEFYETGELFTTVNFKNHKRQGKLREYSKARNLIQLLPFHEGKMQGWAYKYRANGRKINEKYYFQDSMYYLKIFDLKDSLKYLDQIFLTFSFDKENYRKGDTLNFTTVFKSDKLFPYDRKEILLYFDMQKTNGPDDKKVPYEKYFVNLSRDTIKEQLIFMDSGHYLFYTKLLHKNEPSTFVHFEYSKRFYVSE